MESIASEHGHEIIRTFLNWIVEPLPVIRPETAFEEIGAQAALRNVTFPRSRLLARVVGSRQSILAITSWLPVIQEEFQKGVAAQRAVYP
jgi:hypothetical protein